MLKKLFKTNDLILTIVLIICISFSACNSNKKPVSESSSNGIEINIDDYQPDDVVYFSELFDDYEIIPLETKKESLVGAINSIRFCRNNIVVLDMFYSKSVLLFDLNGKFIRKIAKQGKGPGEYIQVDAISTDEKNGEVAIYDGMANQILLYKIDGSYVKTISLKQKFGATSIELVNDNIYAGYTIYPAQEYLLYILDKNGNIIEKLIINEDTNGYRDSNNNSPSTIFFRTDNNLKYRCSSMNTVFDIENNTTQPFIKLKSQKLKSNSETDSRNEEITVTPKKLDINDMSDGTYELFSYVEANNLLIIQYKSGLPVYYLFYDKNTGIAKSTTLRNFKDDLMNRNAGASGYFYSVYNNKLVAVINNGLLFNELLRKIEAGELTSKKHNLKELNENSNPCIIMYKCKPEIVLND